MDRRWITLGALALSSCCCRPCRPCQPCAPALREFGTADLGVRIEKYAGDDLYLAPSNYVPPEDVARPQVPPDVTRELKRIHGLASPDEQRRALATLHAKSPEGFGAVDPALLAGVAPDVLRVYDLSTAIADGGDYPEDGGLPMPGHAAEERSPTPTAPQARLDRIAAGVRRAVGDDAWSATDTLLEGRGRALLVLQALGAFGDVDRALDRLATTGGRVVRLRVDVLAGAGALTESLGVEKYSGEQVTPKQVEDGTAWPAQPIPASHLPDEAALAPFRVDSFVLDVPQGRRVGARRTTSTSYIRDFDVEVSFATRVSDPVIGTLRDGTIVTAGLALDGGADGSLDVDLRRAELIRPIPSFQTKLSATELPVTIELPEFRIARFHGRIDAPAGGAAYLLPAKARGLSALLRVEPAAGPIAPLRSGWRRVAPGPASPPEPFPIVTAEFRFETAAGERLSASRISVFTGQRATVQVVNQTSYIAGFDVETAKGAPPPAGGAAAVADPIIATAAEGISIHLSASPAEGAARVFDLQIAASRIERPIRVMDVPSLGTSAKIQLPVSHDLVVPFRVRLAPGEEKALPPVSIGTKDGPQDVTVWIRYVR